MFQRIIHRITEPRHYWRHVGFDELSELYASTMMHSLGLSLIGIFVPVYLYRIGFSLHEVFWYCMISFASRLVIDACSAYIVGRIGPKHGIALSTVLLVVHLSMLLLLPSLYWPLTIVALVAASAYSLYFISFHTEFSKIKHSKHGGKELGFLTFFERFGSVLGPLVGGIIADIFDPRYTIMLAICVLAVSLWPLFITNEVVQVHQDVHFRGFRWRRHIHDFTANASFGIERVASIMAWPLLISITVFAVNPFAKLGILAALSTGMALFCIHFIGRVIDNRRGGALFRYSVIGNALVHLFRPLVSTVAGVIGINLANEPLTIGYTMPFAKGYYDTADTEPGYRIVYVALFELVGSCAKSLFWFGLWLGSFWWDGLTLLRWCFIPVAFISLLMLSQNFKALKSAV